MEYKAFCVDISERGLTEVIISGLMIIGSSFLQFRLCAHLFNLLSGY